MVAYDPLATYYDAVTGDCATEAALIDRIIERACGRAATLLEVACGTGGIIAALAGRYQVSGLDISPAMLAAARKKLPDGTPLYLADMSDFTISATFDAVVCVYHGLNHLLDFPAWEAFFDCAYRHLNGGGVLIFDMITLRELEVLASGQRTTQQFGDNYLLITVRSVGRVIFDWEIEVFERQSSGKYALISQVIRTTSFAHDKVRKALEERFSKISTIVSDGSIAGADNENRTWFVCTKPEGHEAV